MADDEKLLPNNEVQNQGKQSVSQGSTGEMSRPNNLQRIAQKKAMVKNYSRTKKLEKLAVYSSCKVNNLLTIELSPFAKKFSHQFFCIQIDI